MSVPGLREVTDDDASAVQALVGGVFDEYPGCVLDLDDLDADLLAPRSTFAARGSRLWVVEAEGDVTACVGVGPVGVERDGGSDLPGRVVELKRLYVAERARGRGLGTALVDHVHAVAATLGASAVELWSDTRFAAGHRRYLAAGYEPRPVERALHDPSDTVESAFWRPLTASSALATGRSRTPDGHQARWARFVGPGGQRATSTHVTAQALVTQEVVADEGGHTRRATVRHDGALALDVRGDGLGRWWRDGTPVPALDGCLAIALPGVPHAALDALPTAVWDPAAGTLARR